jgi:transcriptional regulator
MPTSYGQGPRQNRIEVLQGTLDMLILQTLQWGPQHGYGITQAMRINSGDALAVDTGLALPALHRLERNGWVKAAWKMSESNQRVREYRLTPKANGSCSRNASRWEADPGAVAGILHKGAAT